jgi:hypothetical protein
MKGKNRMDEKEIVALLKENAGLKLNCTRYKRKYKALNRVLCGGLHSRIDGLDIQFRILASRIQSTSTPEEKARIQDAIRFVSKQRAELQALYDMCVEITK